MQVSAYASEPQYARHLRPIFDGLPDEMRGTFFVHPRMPGLTGTPGYPRGGVVLVASIQDHRAVRSRQGKTIFVEHGAGQQYAGINSPAVGSGSYAGGRGRTDAVLFICPNERTAELNRAVYRDVPSVAVGCPAMDPWHRDKRVKRMDDCQWWPHVALAFHADLTLCPEMRSAWEHYAAVLPDLVEWAADQDIVLMGHGHPRAEPFLRPAYEKAGIPWRSLEDVLDRADVLVMDNSSVGYEVASLGRPVLCLDAPWYRRQVSHGGRFWESMPGISCSGPDQLIERLTLAMADPPYAVQARARASVWAYDGRVDGHATARAVAAIEDLAR